MAGRTPVRSPRSWTAFVLFAAVASIAAIHGPLIGYKTFANVDEAYAGALAERLLEGYKLYQGAISQRGPLMYYLFEAIGWLHGWDNIVALRAWALALALAHVLLVYWAGARLVSKQAATVAAAVVGYALSFGFPPEDAVAVNGEPLQLPAMMVAVVLGAEAVRRAPGSRERLLRLLGCGVAFGAAIAIKQSVALHPAAVVVYLAIDAHRRRAPFRRVVVDTAWLTAATLVVPAVLIAHAAGQGTLRDLYYYCVTYNRDVHLNPTTKHFAWLPHLFFRLTSQTQFFVVLVLLVARALPYLARRLGAARATSRIWALTRGFGPREYLGVHLALAVFAASTMLRFFPHYYLQALPFLALAIAVAVDPLFRRRGTAWGAHAATTLFMLFTMGAATLGCIFGEKVDGRLAHDRTVIDLSKVITATTSPDDKIFVWGFSPWFYQYSHRRPAGRYVFETYVTGFVPWFWEELDLERKRIVPGSVEALLGDLDREKPAVLIDAGAVMMARPMRSYDAPNAWLHANYCFEVRLGAYDLYRRKTGDAKCGVPYFPRSPPPIDWLGRGLPTPLPFTIDFATSPRLPPGDYYKPIYFPEGPVPPGLEAARDAKRDKEEAEGAAKGFFVQPGMEPWTPPPPSLRDAPNVDHRVP